MKKITLIATCAFGLEAVVKREIIKLGFDDIKVSDGKVEFLANVNDIAKVNLWVRCAERILLKLDEFKVLSFEDLYQGIKKIKWEDLISVNDKFPVNANSVKSKLFSLSDIQKITKRAVVDRLKNVYGVEWFDETSNALYYIEVSILKDIATVTVDTSGEALHKRGYRKRAGDAPLKETLASAMISLSFGSRIEFFMIRFVAVALFVLKPI